MAPLEGFRIVSIAVNLPGPLAVSRLVEMGAEAIKVEPPAGDAMALLNADWYQQMRAGCEVISLNLKDEGDRQRLDKLLEKADLFVTSSLPVSLERMRLDPESLHRRFPKLCHVGVTGYPPPRENEPGHDLTYEADLDLLTPPHLPRVLIPDMAGAEQAVSAALALLFERERTGRAGSRYVALSEAGRDFAQCWHSGVTKPGGLLGGGLPTYNLYPAKDGWIALAAIEAHYNERLMNALDLRKVTHENLAACFAARCMAEWESWARENGIPLTAVCNTDGRD